MAQSSAIRRCGTLGQITPGRLITSDLAMRARGQLEPGSNDQQRAKSGPAERKRASPVDLRKVRSERPAGTETRSLEPLLGLPFVDDDAESILGGKARPGAASPGCGTTCAVTVMRNDRPGRGVRTSDQMRPISWRAATWSAGSGLGCRRSGCSTSRRPTRIRLGSGFRDRGIDRRAKKKAIA